MEERTLENGPTRHAWSRLGRLVAAAGVLSLAAAGMFSLHAELSTAAPVEFMLVVFSALQWGFVEATAAAVAAVLCLDFFFIPPLLSLSVHAPHDWVSLLTFEATALVVSRLSSKARIHARESEAQRHRMAKLYELSRAILLIDPKLSVSAQLSSLIRELIDVDSVIFLLESEGESTVLQDRDDEARRCSYRVLRVGTAPRGTIELHGWQIDTQLADAVASLAAVALERARAMEKETRAEIARDAEQLRTAVLDGLAHGFKTPLTAIQTASSGLLAIGKLSDTQLDLVQLVDEQATLLGRMTTRLLQTAALEAREMRVRRTLRDRWPLAELVQSALDSLPAPARARIQLDVQPGLESVAVDAELVTLAVAQLLENADRYAEVGTGILVRVHESEAEAEVLVQNQGTPIRFEDRERIFERFQRGAQAAYGPSGTGLGLSIVRKAAEAHGGRAWVECEGNLVSFHFTVSRLGGAQA